MDRLMGIFNLKLSGFWRDAAYLASGTALAQLIALAAKPVFSRLYTPADFATLNLFTVVAGFLSILATWRYEYLVQLPRRRSDAWRLVQAALLLGGLAALILTPLAFWQGARLAAWLDHPPLASWLVLAPLAGLLLSLSAALAAWHQKRRQFRRSGQSEVAGQLANAALGGLGWSLLAGPGGLILAFLGTYGGKIIWLIKNRRDIYPRGSLVKIKAAARNYGALAKGLILSQICLTATVAIPSFYIAKTYGAGELGQFSLAWQIIIQPAVLLGNAIGSTYYQRAAELWAQGSSFKGLWRSTIEKLLLMGLPVYGAAFCLSPWLFPLIFGPAWVKAGQYAAVLSISSFFSLATDPLSKTCLVVGVWRYISLWHLARTVSTALVALAAWRASWAMENFLVALVIQQSSLYLFDLWAEWRFAGFSPKAGRRPA
jgi:O-antigen/teichoic acid export membrane protein